MFNLTSVQAADAVATVSFSFPNASYEFLAQAALKMVHPDAVQYLDDEFFGEEEHDDATNCIGAFMYHLALNDGKYAAKSA